MSALEAEPRLKAPAARSARLTSPSDGASVDAAYATFEWEAVPGADGYRFAVAEDPDFTSTVVDASVGAATSLTLFETFPPDGVERFWRLEALDGDQRLSISPVHRFRPVTDTELEREQLPQKPIVRRAPVQRRIQKVTADELADRLTPGVEPWRSASTSGSIVFAFAAVLLLMVVVFALTLIV